MFKIARTAPQAAKLTTFLTPPVFKLSLRTSHQYRFEVNYGAKMSDKHLGFGSEKPPKLEEGKLRLYSMKFCPFAHRARLVLRAKNIPHEIVNINLMRKPEWIYEINPEGKVPALDVGDQVIVESIDICEYLEENYPEPPLYPKDTMAREQDRSLYDTIGKLSGTFLSLVLGRDLKTGNDWKRDLVPHLEVLEEELKSRGTPFFGGQTPGMVDFMLWPWAERSGTTTIVLGDRLPFKKDEFPVIRKWKESMREDPVVAELYIGPEKFYNSVQIKLGEMPPDYDDL